MPKIYGLKTMYKLGSHPSYRKNSTRNSTSKVPARTKAKPGPAHVKTVKLHQNASAIPGSGGTFSKFFYGRRKAPKAYRSVIGALSKNFQVYNGSGRAGAAVGLQDVQVPLTMFNSTDVQALLTNIQTNWKNTRAVLMSCSAEVLLTNQDIGNARITLYDIVARRDLAASNVSDPSTAWGHSYGDQTASNSNSNLLGSTPFSADLFTQFFKVLKITHITLGQGQSHTHRVHYQPNKKIDGEYVQYENQGFKGLTCFTMMVDHGMPYNDTTTKTSVSSGKSAIDYVWRKQYKYTFVSDVSNTYYVTNSLPGSFAVSESVMDIGSGATVVETAA